VLASCIVSTNACSVPLTSVVGVEGQWCGKVVGRPQYCTGDGVDYAEFKVAGPAVTGKMCEAFEKACYDILKGTLSGSELTFYYTSGNDRVDAVMTVNADTLDGHVLSTKTSEPVAIRLHRIP
jgi:hypothetical protein